MRKFIYFSLLFSVLLLSSCKSDKEGSVGTNESLTVSNSEVQGQTASDIINSEAQEPLGPVTKIKFKSDTYDYGKVMEGKVVEHDYVFTNEGEEPLLLKNVKASCGCTTPSWPREPIAPGASGKIHAAFDTNGRGAVGGAVQSKTITVTGNFEGGTLQLTLKGLVDKKEDPNAPKPVSPK
ncbi:MAG: DUF1573 domain-containing protein [Saprospiraceae bacterium]|nr:DUF1573 domain-containing protein [Saprospiraceae bacterium]